MQRSVWIATNARLFCSERNAWIFGEKKGKVKILKVQKREIENRYIWKEIKRNGEVKLHTET